MKSDQFKIREQKSYTREIMKRALGEKLMSEVHRKYFEYKAEHGLSRGAGAANKSRFYQNYHPKYLKKIIDDFEGFKYKYEMAKSPTANNLPKTDYSKSIPAVVRSKDGFSKGDLVKVDDVLLKGIKRFVFLGKTIFEIQEWK